MMLAIVLYHVKGYLKKSCTDGEHCMSAKTSIFKIFAGKQAQLLFRFQTVWEEIKWLKLLFERHDLFLIIQIAWDTVSPD